MAATTTANRTNVVGLEQVVEHVESGAAVRASQNALLSELPGVTFAFLTLAYVVISLMALS
jgi:cyanate permease